MKLIAELRDIPGVLVQESEPSTKEDGSALDIGNVWIDTSDPDNPDINLWTGTEWQPTAARDHTHLEEDVTDLEHRQWIGPWTLDNAGA